MKRWLLGVGAVLSLFLVMGFGGVSLYRWAGRVNRPDPATYRLDLMARQARAAGVEARIERALFIDRDANAAIFVARDVRLDPRLIRNGRYIDGSGRWGEVRVRPLPGGRTLVAYVAATTRGEWAQAQPRFSAWVAEAERNANR